MLLYTRYVTMFNYSLTHPIFLYVFSSLTRLKLSMYSLQARGGSLFLSGWRLWLPGKSNFHPYPGHTTGSKDHNTSLRSIRKISRRGHSRLFWFYQVNISVLSGINPMLDIEIYKFSELGPKKYKILYHSTLHSSPAVETHIQSTVGGTGYLRPDVCLLHGPHPRFPPLWIQQ